MKLLLCHNRYQQRTGEDVVYDYVRSLLGGGHQIIEFTRSNDVLKSQSLLRSAVDAAQVVYSPAVRREVRGLAERERPDAAIVQNVFPLMSPSVYYGLVDAGVPIVQMVFNYRFACANGQLYSDGRICERCVTGSHFNAALHACYRSSYALSALYALSLAVHRAAKTWSHCIDAFVVPDQFLAGKLSEAGLPGERMHVIPNAFDATEYTPNYDRGKYALFIGRMVRAKGILTLLDAAARLKDLRVVIAGAGDEEESARRHPAVVSGRVELAGPAYGERFTELMRDAAFVVVPSEWYDNLPMIVCQAFAFGKPVVASRISGIEEYVVHESNGLLFEPANAAELASQMERLHGDNALRERLARNARRSAEVVFSPDAWLRNMNDILRQVTRTVTHAAHA